MLLAVTVVPGFPQVVVTDVALRLNVGVAVLDGTATPVVPVAPEQPLTVLVMVTE